MIVAEPQDIRSRRLHRAVVPVQVHTYANQTNVYPSVGGPSPSGAGNQIRLITPTAVMKLKHLHETFLHRASKDQKLIAAEAEAELQSPSVPEAKLEDWGRAGSWQVINKLPPLMERPMQIRNHRLLPETAADPEAWLAERNMAVINSKGRKSSRDTAKGQDCFSLSHLPNGWEVLCVMDGHGPQGHWPSFRACRTVPFFLRSRSCSMTFKQRGAQAALVDVFEQVTEDLKATAPMEAVNLQSCGTTAVCVMWHEEKDRVWVATAGDSRAIMFSSEGRLIKETTDHKGDIEAERKRIEASGGEVVVSQRSGGRTEARVRIKGQEYPNIAMSRSLGDLSMKEYGLTHEPEVVGWECVQDSFILAASDGVWEFLSSEAVAHMVTAVLQQGGSHKDACNEVLQASRKRWSKNVGVYCDDITIALVPVSPGGAARERPRRANVSCESACSVM